MGAKEKVVLGLPGGRNQGRGDTLGAIQRGAEIKTFCGQRRSSHAYNSSNSGGVSASIARSISWTVFKLMTASRYFGTEGKISTQE